MTEHTPLPWKTTGYLIAGADNLDVCNTSKREDAAYIVQACNAYPNLIEALRGVKLMIEIGEFEPYEGEPWFEKVKALEMP